MTMEIKMSKISLYPPKLGGKLGNMCRWWSF